MTATPLRRRWHGPPLAFQILGLLIGGLVVAQLVTLFLTMVLPPAPPAQYGLDDIAEVLRGELRSGGRGGLQRVVQAGPPDLSGPGWLVSERSRHELAALLRVGDGDVSLSFYTPLPFAGTASRRPMAAMVDDGPIAGSFAVMAEARAIPAVFAGRAPARLILAQAPAAPPPPAIPRGDERSGFGLPRHDSFPPGVMGGGRPFEGRPLENGARGARGLPGGAGFQLPTRGALFAIDPRPLPGAGPYIPGDGGVAVPPLLRTPPPIGTTGTPATPGQLPAQADALSAARREAEGRFQPPPEGFRESAVARGLPGREGMPGVLSQPLPATPILTPATPAAPAIRSTPRPPGPPVGAAILTPVPRDPPAAEPFAPLAIAPVAPGAAAAAPPPIAGAALDPAGPPITVTPPARGLFGFVAAPFVEGDFVAALRLPDGHWSVVQPADQPFPNAWQRRLLLWFAVAFAIVAPLGWLFARRLVKPLAGFAAAAEALGRDPAAAILALDGPAEIGRAARAFNLMQSRLRSFVDDRTAMVGAISHDLRTPLTRLRFRIEDVPDDQRDGMLEEVAEMEAMISSVLEFIRDASTPNLRERLDLRALLDDVAEDAVMIGNDVTVERGESATVEVDVLGMRRVLDNLLDNAVKYGARARVRLRTEPDSAVAEIFDDGPGLPEDELERVFEPFYRSEAAQSSGARGSGLGLAVCRSITRAHGGDVVLLRSTEGFVAQVRVPLAYRNERPLAA